MSSIYLSHALGSGGHMHKVGGGFEQFNIISKP